MKYFKYRDEWSEIDNATTYVEEEDGSEVRRITYNGDTYLASNIIGPDGHLNIADTAVEYEKWADEEGNEGGVLRITKAEFDAIWEPYLATRLSEWNQAKLNYPVGMNVIGVTHRFLPKGEIVELENDVLGFIDYSSRKPQFMHPQGKLMTIVKGYDEENQRIILEYAVITQSG